MTLTLGYLRVSTDEQAREDRASLAQQRAAILAKAGGDVRWFEDAGFSGGTAEGRPGFTALVDYCKAHPQPLGKPGVVLCLNASRWGRFDNPEEAAYWRVLLDKRGWRVRYCEGDHEGDAANIVRAVHDSTAADARRQIKANAKRGAEGSARQGFWANEAPVGYRRRTLTGRVLERGERKADTERVKLTPGPDHEVAMVRRLFTRYASGTVTLAQLIEDARRTVPDLKWSRTYMGRLLRNPAYVGDVVWCRRPHDARDRLVTPVRPRSEWVETRDAHPPLVSRELFAKVARRLEGNRRQRVRAGGYLLTGMLTCAHCGDTFIGGGGPKGPPEDVNRYRFYVLLRDDLEGGPVLDGDPAEPLDERRLTPALRPEAGAVGAAVGGSVGHEGPRDRPARPARRTEALWLSPRTAAALEASGLFGGAR